MKSIIFLSITTLLFNSCKQGEAASRDAYTTPTQVVTMIVTSVRPINNKNGTQDKALVVLGDLIAEQNSSIEKLTKEIAVLNERTKKLEDSLSAMVKVLSFDFSYDNLNHLIISPSAVQRIKAEVLK